MCAPAAGAKLLETRHEGEHHPQRTVLRRAEEGPQLRLKDLLDGEAEADAAKAERRAGAVDGRMVDSQLCLADVERPDGHAPAADFAVKATLTGRRYYTEGSANFGETRADVWFRTESDAEKAGFRPAP